MLDELQPVRPLCLPATLLGLPAPAGARTVTSARLIVFPASELRAMVRDDPAVGQRLLDYSLHETQMLTQQVYVLKLRNESPASEDCYGSRSGKITVKPGVWIGRWSSAD